MSASKSLYTVVYLKWLGARWQVKACTSVLTFSHRVEIVERANGEKWLRIVCVPMQHFPRVGNFANPRKLLGV